MSTKKEEQKQYSRSSNTTNPQEAKKEVEKITDDAKKRKEATTIAKKLETRVEESEGKNQAMIKILDESKDNNQASNKRNNSRNPTIHKNCSRFSRDSHGNREGNFRCVHRITKASHRLFAIDTE